MKGHSDKLCDYLVLEVLRGFAERETGASRVGIDVSDPVIGRIPRHALPSVCWMVCNPERPHLTCVRLLLLKTTDPKPISGNGEHTSFVYSLSKPTLTLLDLHDLEPPSLAQLHVFIHLQRNAEPRAAVTTGLACPRVNLRPRDRPGLVHVGQSRGASDLGDR